jgi:acetyl esterase/lipase
MQREGWNVLTLHYRGSWGSPGQYSFGHCLEDAAAALAWLRDPNTASAPEIDPGKIVVIGHSLGGFVAAYTGGHDPAVMATGLISAANLGGGMGAAGRATAARIIDDNIGTSAGMHTLNASPDSLADEVIRNAKDWNVEDWADALARRPLLIVTSDDGLAPANEALRDKAKAAGGEPTYVHLSTDHSYDDHRIALEAAVIRWLENLPGAPAGL